MTGEHKIEDAARLAMADLDAAGAPSARARTTLHFAGIAAAIAALALLATILG